MMNSTSKFGLVVFSNYIVHSLSFHWKVWKVSDDLWIDHVHR